MNSKEIVHRVGPRYSTGKKYEDLRKVLPIIPHSSNNLTELLISLNTETDAKKLPTWISIDLGQLENSGFSLTVDKTVDVIQNTSNLARIRLGANPVQLKFSGFVHTVVSSSLIEKLKQNNFVGMTCTIGGHGWDPCVDFNQDLLKEHWVWPKLLTGADCRPTGPTDMSTVGSIIQLTPRQHEILRLIVYRGLSNKQIARHLTISESAVKIHISILLNKYAVRSRSQLTAFLKNT
jgi:DNA-binding CsgD family transcriptional regulator